MNLDSRDEAFPEPPETAAGLPEALGLELSIGGPAPGHMIPDQVPTGQTPSGHTPPDHTPIDGRVPWSWADIGLLAVVAIGSTFLYGVVIVLVLAAMGIHPSHVQKSTTESGMVAVVAQILADLSVMVYLAVQARVRFRSLFWNLLGWRKLETGELPRGLVYGGFVLGGFFLAILVTLLDSAFPTKQALPIQALLEDHRTAILFMLTAVLVAPVVEETIFRGYIYPVCVRSFGTGWGILVTGTMFGLLHSVQLWGGWWQIGFLILVGIVLTAARAATGTVVASFLVHVSYNALPVIAYVIATHGFRQAPVLH